MSQPTHHPPLTPTLADMSNFNAPVKFSTLHNMMVHLIGLSIANYTKYSSLICDNTLHQLVDIARHANITYYLTKKTIKDLSPLCNQLKNAKNDLFKALKAIIELLHQSPVGTHVPTKFYKHLGHPITP